MSNALDCPVLEVTSRATFKKGFLVLKRLDAFRVCFLHIEEVAELKPCVDRAFYGKTDRGRERNGIRKFLIYSSLTNLEV